MIRFSDWHTENEENKCIKCDEEQLLLDENVWSRIREKISRNKYFRKIPVFSIKSNMICTAYQDDDANRELRMLRELIDKKDSLGFRDLFPEYDGVTIYGFNELAWEFANYLKKQNIIVNVEGKLWDEIGYVSSDCKANYSYIIYAEGTWQKSQNKLIDKLRSVSFCFECIDIIYEENIRTGKIKDAAGDFQVMLDLIQEKDVVLIGTSNVEDVYDMLLGCGIDVSCFCSQEEDKGRQIFGKPVLTREDIVLNYESPVFIECSKRNSAWEQIADEYDYIGFRRNKEFFLIKDYENVSDHMLQNVLTGKRIILLGDIDYCNNLYMYLKDCMRLSGIFYVDALEEEQEGCLVTEIGISEIGKEDICCLMIPDLIEADRISINKQRKKNYVEKLNQNGIINYTDYFMKQNILIRFEEKKEKYSADLRPLGICVGAILGHSGNILVRDILDGHPKIILMDYTWLNQNLFYLCVKLAGKPGKEIVTAFEQIYNDLAGEMDGIVFNRVLFQKKLNEYLENNRVYTSQELFVIFHLADAAMWNKNVININEVMIYWEPHFVPITDCVNYIKWLEDDVTRGKVLNVARDSIRRGGSGLKEFEKLEGLEKRGIKNFYSVFDLPLEDELANIEKNKKLQIKFEDLKCRPRDTIKKICDECGIPWEDSLLQTTCHGKIHSYMGVTGFDLTPVYNNYEEYFSGYDRMRIELITAPWRMAHMYSYISCLNFSMLELQEMFLKDFRFEEKMTFDNEDEKLKLKWRVTLWERRMLRECRKNQLLKEWGEIKKL